MEWSRDLEVTTERGKGLDPLPQQQLEHPLEGSGLRCDRMGTAQWFLQNGTAVLSGGTASGLLMPGKKEAGCSGVRVPFTRSPGSHLHHDTTLQPVMDSFSASASHLSDGCINRCLANWFGLGKHKLLQKRGFLPLRFAYIYIYVCIVNIPGVLRVDTNMR